MPAVAQLVLEFPRWTEETIERLLGWVMYFAGRLPRELTPPLASWEAFAELAERAPDVLGIRRIQDPSALRVALLQALACQRAFVPDELTARERARPYTPARGES